MRKHLGEEEFSVVTLSQVGQSISDPPEKLSFMWRIDGTAIRQSGEVGLTRIELHLEVVDALEDGCEMIYDALRSVRMSLPEMGSTSPR